VKKIAVEEHFTTPEHLDCLRAILLKEYPNKEILEEEKYFDLDVRWLAQEPGTSRTPNPFALRLMDLGEGRIKRMTENSIDMQVLSLVAPGVQLFEASRAIEMAEEINNQLAQSIARNPTKFIGLAVVAPQNPEKAADELERAVRKLNLKGAVVNSHTKGEYLDNRKYWVIFERAESWECRFTYTPDCHLPTC